MSEQQPPTPSPTPTPAAPVAAPAVPAPAPPPAGPPPGAFPAPAAGSWGSGAAPAQGNRRRPAVIVGGAVAAVAVLGGVFGVINLTRDKAEPASPNVLPTPVPDPGPTPSTLPVVTIPGPQPPPTVVTTTIPPSTTTTQPEPPPPPPSDAQVVFDRISVGVPDGWDVLTAEEGRVLLGTDGAEYLVLADRIDADAETIVRNWVSDPGGLDGYTVTGTSPLDLPSSAVVSGFAATWEAVLVTQQGSLPVEGVVIVYITQDGIAVLTETFNAVGDFESYAHDFDAMLGSVVASL
jgi:hypothetical protein